MPGSTSTPFLVQECFALQSFIQLIIEVDKNPFSLSLCVYNFQDMAPLAPSTIAVWTLEMKLYSGPMRGQYVSTAVTNESNSGYSLYLRKKTHTHICTLYNAYTHPKL